MSRKKLKELNLFNMLIKQLTLGFLQCIMKTTNTCSIQTLSYKGGCL